MKKIWDTLLVFVKTKRALYAGVAVAVVIIAMVALGGNKPKPTTMTVHPGDFVQQVSVSGKVVAAKDVDLGLSQGGRVAGVYVVVGDAVGAGRVLAETENGDLKASLEAEQAALASLQAGTRPEEIAVAEAEVESDQSALADATHDAATAAGNAMTKVDQFISNPRGPNPQITFSTSDSQIEALVEGERAALEPALKAGTASLADVATLLKNCGAAITRGIPSGTVTQAVLDGYATDIATARTSVNTAASTLTNATAALNTAQKNLTLKKAGATPEDIQAQEARVKAAQANLDKTRIVAPFSGIVSAVNAKVGATVAVGTPAISLIGSQFQIESYVPEVNVALVAVGNPASATLDAYGTDVEFPAKVASIDPAETLRDGVSTYRTILAFMTKDSRVRAGMTANVIIRTDEKQNVIAIPQGLVTERDGKKYVQVLVNGAASEREVTTGELSSTGTIEIVTGLADGDTLVVPK